MAYLEQSPYEAAQNILQFSASQVWIILIYNLYTLILYTQDSAFLLDAVLEATVDSSSAYWHWLHLLSCSPLIWQVAMEEQL